MTDRLISTRELQEFLNLDRITIYRMVQAGELPAMKLGGQWRFSRSEIEQWLKGHQAAPPAPARSSSPAEALALGLRPLDALSVCDLVAPSCIEIIQASFAAALDVAIGIADLTGALTLPFARSCSFCEYGWSSPLFSQRCRASWSGLSQAGGAEPELHCCHAGLSCATAPVIVQGQRLGHVVADQFLTASPDDNLVRRLRNTAEECQLEPALLRSRLVTVHVLTPERVGLIPPLLSTVAVAISEIAGQNFHVRQKLALVAQTVGRLQ